MENIKPVIELELYLVRHGQSKGNAGLVEEGASFTEINDVHLTELGVMQAKKAGRYLKDVEFDVCYASGLIRTVQTANEIMNFQKEKKTLNILPIITEIGVNPEFPGRTIEELKEACETAQVAEGFEDAERLVVYSTHAEEEALYERATKAIAYFRSRYKNGEKVLVAGHAAFNTVMIFHIMGFTQSPVFDIEITNTGITHIIFYKEGTNKYGDIVFESINDTKHFTIPDEEVLSQSSSASDDTDIYEPVKDFVTKLKKKSLVEDTNGFVDVKDKNIRMADEIMHFIPVEKWQKLRSLVTGMQSPDMHLRFTDCTNFACNPAFKENEELHAGSPIFDFGYLYKGIQAEFEIDENSAETSLGYSFETAKRVWKLVLKLYFEGEEEAFIKRVDDRARLLAYFDIFHRLTKVKNCNKAVYTYYKEKLIEYVTRVGSLDFE